jgi:LysR family transcriptional regulator (chromosome initiation inhibitor)
MPPIHYLPTSTGFVEAAAHSLGWCLAQESLVTSALQSKTIVNIDPERWLDAPHYWQQVAVHSSTLQHIGRALREVALSVLRV